MTLGGLAIAVGLLVDAAIIVTENIVHHLQQRPGRVAARGGAARRAAGRPADRLCHADRRRGVRAAVRDDRHRRPDVPPAGRRGRRGAGGIAGAGAHARAGRGGDPASRAAPRRRRGRLDHAAASSGSTRRCSTARCGMPASSRWRRSPSRFRRSRWRCSSARTSCRSSTKARFSCRPIMPPDTALDEVDRINHRVEDVLRKFDDVEDVVRRTGRAERTEDPMPHVVSDVLVVLKPERVGRYRSRWRPTCARRSRAFRVSRSCSRRRSACGSTRGSAARRPICPCASSDRISNELARLGGQVQRLMADIDGIEDLRVEAVTGLPQLRVTIDRPRGRAHGSDAWRRRAGAARRSGRRRSVRGVGRSAAVRPGRPARRLGAQQRVRDPQPAARSARRHAYSDRPGRARRGSAGARHDPARRRATGGSRSKRASPGATSAAPPRTCANDWRQVFSCRPGTSSTSAAASNSRSGRRSR